MQSEREGGQERGGELIIEEIDDPRQTADGRTVPVARDLNNYIDAIDMRIGKLHPLLYAQSGARARLQSCAQSYRSYILGVTDVQSTPLGEAVHLSLNRRIAEIRDVASPPLSTRIGNATINGDNTAALLPILVTTENGYITGELECRNIDDRWQLYNFVIDIDRLASGLTEEPTQFNPLLF